MIPRFKPISKPEYEQLKDAITLIAIMIAGADGTIDEKEIEWAKKVIKIRSYSSKDILMGFYSDIGQDFESRLEKRLSGLPENHTSRNDFISAQLGELNDILAKLDQELAYELYTSFLSFAEHVAKASGGFLRFFSISSEEKKLIKLHMLTPIEKPLDEEETEEA